MLRSMNIVNNRLGKSTVNRAEKPAAENWPSLSNHYTTVSVYISFFISCL